MSCVSQSGRGWSKCPHFTCVQQWFLDRHPTIPSRAVIVLKRLLGYFFQRVPIPPLLTERIPHVYWCTGISHLWWRGNGKVELTPSPSFIQTTTTEKWETYRTIQDVNNAELHHSQFYLPCCLDHLHLFSCKSDVKHIEPTAILSLCRDWCVCFGVLLVSECDRVILFYSINLIPLLKESHSMQSNYITSNNVNRLVAIVAIQVTICTNFEQRIANCLRKCDPLDWMMVVMVRRQKNWLKCWNRIIP